VKLPRWLELKMLERFPLQRTEVRMLAEYILGELVRLDMADNIRALQEEPGRLTHAPIKQLIFELETRYWPQALRESNGSIQKLMQISGASKAGCWDKIHQFKLEELLKTLRLTSKQKGKT
jgi:hypothetical protein